MVVLSPLVVAAQNDERTPPGYSVVQPGPPKGAANAPVGKREITLEQLRDRLALSEPQRVLWQAFEGKVTAYTEDLYREKPVLASQEVTAAQQISRLVDKQQNRLAALEEVERATKNLYATLTTAQQKTADQLLLATIPIFSAGEGARPGPDAARRKAEKPEGGQRGHRGGAGGMGGGMGAGG
jgi:hypothetical protein